MDKETLIRTILAAAIVLALFLVWQTWFSGPRERPAERPSAPAEKPEGPEKPEEVEKPPAGQETAPGVEIYALGVSGAAEPAEPVVLGSDAPVGPFDLEGEVHAEGAALRRLTLARKAFFKTVADRDLPPEKRQPMHLVDPDVPEPVLAVEEVRVRLKDRPGWGRARLADVPWRLEPSAEEGTSAVFAVDVEDEQGNRLLTVRREYSLFRRGATGGEVEGADVPQYEFRTAVEVEAHQERVEQVYYVLHGPSALAREGRRQDYRQVVIGTWTGGQVEVRRFAGEAAQEEEDLPRIGPEMAWMGQVDKYFAVIVVPLIVSPQGTHVMPEAPPSAGTFAAGAEVSARMTTEDREKVALPIVRLRTKAAALKPGEPVRHEFAVFAGPKEPDYLETYYRHIGLDRLVNWSRCCIPGIAYISRALLTVVEAFHAVVANWGVAIIMLVLALRILLLPVSKWSAKSMADMQRMAPKMQEIRQKYANDQKKMQEELAKIGGFRAFGGCLPMFLQMPIWIGLYTALLVAIQLRHSAFLPAAWIPDGSLFLQDLSAPDMLLHWDTPLYLPGQDIPLLGWLIGGIQAMLGGGGGITSFNLLPILVGVGLYLQQKLMPMASAAAANPQAQKQQKMMMKIMPVFLGVVLYSAPSGLCLYIFTSTTLGFLENRFFRRRWVEAAKAKAEGAEPAETGGAVKERSLVSGRRKSIGERIESWVRQKTEEAQKQARQQPRSGKKRKK